MRRGLTGRHEHRRWAAEGQIRRVKAAEMKWRALRRRQRRRWLVRPTYCRSTSVPDTHTRARKIIEKWRTPPRAQPPAPVHHPVAPQVCITHCSPWLAIFCWIVYSKHSVTHISPSPHFFRCFRKKKPTPASPRPALPTRPLTTATGPFFGRLKTHWQPLLTVVLCSSFKRSFVKSQLGG